MELLKKSPIKKTLSTLMVSAAIMSLTSCAAMSTAIKHRNLKVTSKTSESIFLDPVADKDKTVYVQVKSTLSDDFDGLKEMLVTNLEHNGWHIVNDLGKANDMIQVNVLQAGQAKNEASAWATLTGGFGSNILAGGLAGLAVGYGTDSVGAGMVAGGLVSGVSWLANQLVEDVTYSMVTDVQVSVRSKDGQVTQTTQANLNQGSQTHVKQTYNQKSDWVRYRTRIVSVADQVNLKFKEAKPELQAQVAKQVSGILG